ncbi:MAG: tetratricopeptide (TPR) repeat protein [Cellvibrionaceae bacterium]|jgi:tetratricopeptide (TPR) repeat protein
MGKELVNKILPLLKRIEWTDSTQVTQFGLQTYEMGMDWVDQYDGDVSVLQTAIKTFRSSDSQPYAFAGVAYLLANVSREGDGSYDLNGLDEAMQWLSMAQDIEPDRPQINFIEALIYLFKGELENARLVLNYLSDQASHVYRFNITEAMWCEKVEDYEGMDEFYTEAEKTADTVPKKLRIQSLLGDAYIKIENFEKALKHYNQAIYFNRENDKLWHKMSLIYWKQQNYEECKRCNDIVMRLKPTKSAQRVQEELKKKMGSG